MLLRDLWDLVVENNAVPSCSLGQPSLERWASRWEGWLSWGFHAVRKPNPRGRPHENAPAGHPSFQALLTQVSNMQVNKFSDDSSPQLSSQPPTFSLLSWGLRHGGGEVQISHPHSVLFKSLLPKHSKIVMVLCHCVQGGVCYEVIGTRTIEIKRLISSMSKHVQLFSTGINTHQHLLPLTNSSNVNKQTNRIWPQCFMKGVDPKQLYLLREKRIVFGK